MEGDAEPVLNLAIGAPDDKTPAALRAALTAGPAGAFIDRLIVRGRLRIEPGRDPQGAMAWTASDGTISLFAGSLVTDPSAVLLHEGFHSGIRPLIGSKAWSELLDRLDSLYRQFERPGTGARRFFDAARERVADVEALGLGHDDARITVEESGAYAIEEYENAPAALKRWVDDVLGAIKAWVLRRFGRQIGDVTPAELRALAIAALRDAARGGGTTTSSTTHAVEEIIAADSPASVAPPDDEPGARFAGAVLSELAVHDELFQNPVSRARNLAGVFADIMPEVKIAGTIDPSDTDRENRVERKTLLRTNRGKDFFVFEDDDNQVWMDVSRLDPGSRGSAIYAAVANYAHNAGKVFIGDPEGLSDVALRRRTEAMLASALKFGTTRHLAPHPTQTRGNKRLGVPPLRWRPGDDAGNIESLIETSIASIRSLVPEIDRARYDFDSRTFRRSSGEPLSDEMLDGWASRFGRVRAAGAGRSTLKRSILLATLSRAEGGERPRLLEQALRLSRELVERGGLRDTFYSVGPGNRRTEPDRRFSAAPATVGARAAQITSTDVADAIGGRLTSLKQHMLAFISLNYFGDLKRPGMVAVDRYLKIKDEMDAWRGKKHAEMDEIAQEWPHFAGHNRPAAQRLADLMHASTLAGIDPTAIDPKDADAPREAAMLKRWRALPPSRR